MKTVKFAYENLEVWNRAVDFAVEVINTVEEISTGRKHYRKTMIPYNNFELHSVFYFEP